MPRNTPTFQRDPAPAPDKKPPAYRRRSGYSQAIVTLTDAATGKRRDYWLGEFGTPASRELYHRLLAEWEAAGRRLPDKPTPAPSDRTAHGATTVNRVIRDYWRWAKTYYSGSALSGVRMALRVLRDCAGSTDAALFGPNSLRVVRESMIHGESHGPRPRRAWCRKTVNTRVGHIVRMFRWAASREIVDARVYQSLQTLPPLKRGRCAAPDHEPVTLVPEHAIDAVRPFLGRHVEAVVDLQLLTGARPGELLGMRACDLETSPPGGVWAYRPARHKNSHRGKGRTIFLGPRAQQILSGFLSTRPTDAYLFSPAEAERERLAGLHARRTTPLSCGNRPGTNRREDPRTGPGERYTTASYRRAISRACDRAFPPPPHLRPREPEDCPPETRAAFLARLGPAEKHEIEAWRKRHRWNPYQLRHNAATRIRREFGLEAAQLVLGHSSAVITDAVYAERDEGKLVSIISKCG